MLPQTHTPRVMYIELSGIISIITYMVNQNTNTNYITDEIAHQIAFDIFNYELNIRCLWSKRPRVSLGVIDIEKIVLPLHLPDELKQYIIYNCHEMFDLIEITINELMDLCIPRETWDILTTCITSNSNIVVKNEGDYRIYDWVKHQQESKSEFAKIYSEKRLGI